MYVTGISCFFWNTSTVYSYSGIGRLMMSGEFDKCGKHCLDCRCLDPSLWLNNWIELLDKSSSCDRCGTTLMPKLYCLSEQFPNIEVCHLCSDAYWAHIRDFVNDIHERKKQREEEKLLHHRPVLFSEEDNV